MVDEKLQAIEAEIAELEKPVVEAEVLETPAETPEPIQEEKPVIDEQKVERKVYSMSVEKHQKQMENQEARIRAEYEEKLKTVQTQAPVVTDDIAKFAEEKGIDVSVVQGLLDIAEKRIADKLPKVDMSSIEELKKEREIEKARHQINQDFDAKVLPLMRQQNPDVTLEQVQKVKERIEQLAFTKEYNTYPVEDIYAVKAREFTFTPKVSAESSRGGQGVMTDFETVSNEQLAKMSPQEAEKYFKYMDTKRGGSRYSN